MGELANAIWSARLAAFSTTEAVFSMAESMAVPMPLTRAAKRSTTSAAPVAAMKSCTDAAFCARRVGRGRSGEERSVRFGRKRREGGRRKKRSGRVRFLRSGREVSNPWVAPRLTWWSLAGARPAGERRGCPPRLPPPPTMLVTVDATEVTADETSFSNAPHSSQSCARGDGILRERKTRAGRGGCAEGRWRARGG